MKKILFLLIIILISLQGYSQNPTPPGNIYDLELRNWLRNNWYNGFHNSLGYSSAREEMYSYIDNESGQVYCVYTGFHQSAAFTSFLNPINCEHTVPQSFFDSGEPMKSDIHHLYPTHQDVNTARSNNPYAEINDSSTDKWFVGDASGITESNTIPSVDIENYSELNTGQSFEPREDHKGNVARAIFYFYTMYPTQAGDMSAIAELNTLYQWHLEDPVDAQEIIRNNKTQDSQGNYNPYISHPDLVAKAWGFFNISVGEHQNENTLKVYPNPAQNYLVFNTNQAWEYKIISLLGKIVEHGTLTKGMINIQDLKAGKYAIVLQQNDLIETLQFIKK